MVAAVLMYANGHTYRNEIKFVDSDWETDFDANSWKKRLGIYAQKCAQTFTQRISSMEHRDFVITIEMRWNIMRNIGGGFFVCL